MREAGVTLRLEPADFRPRWALYLEAAVHVGWITAGWWWVVVQHPEWLTFGH